MESSSTLPPREAMEFDVVIVGAGPAGLAAAIRLKQLAASPRHVVPGHDPLVLQRYPALNSQTAGFVHRLDVPRLD